MKKRIKTKKKENHNFLFTVIILFAIVIILQSYIDIKLLLSGVFLIILILSYLIHGKEIGQELIIAFLIALAWTSYFAYEYTTTNFNIGDINTFPLIAWTLGLVILREIYEKIKSKHKLVIVSAIYVIALILVEYLGYYWLGIKLNSNYPSLLGLGVLHAPVLWKIFYLVIGPIYLVITNYMKVK